MPRFGHEPHADPQEDSLMRDGVPRTKASLIQPLAEHFQLTDDEVLETYKGKKLPYFPAGQTNLQRKCRFEPS